MGLVLCCLLTSISWLTAQDIIHPFDTDATFTVAVGDTVNYYDNGGAGCDILGSGSYLNNSDASAIICPDVAGEPVTIEFLEVDVESRNTTAPCWDFINIFDGNSTTAPQILSGCGEDGFAVCDGGFAGDGGDGFGIEGGANDINGTNTAAPANNIFTSSDSTGCLTVQFTSDGSVDNGGWTALVSAPAASDCAGSFGPFCYDLTSTVIPLAVDICPDPGQAIQIDFTAGQVENFFDELQVFCGAMGSGTGGTQIYNAYGTGGDLTGLSFSCPLADQCISVYVNSDGSVTCASQGFTPIEFTSSCIEPAFDDVVGACYDDDQSGSTLLEICPATGFSGVDVEFFGGEIESGFDDLSIYSGPAGSGATDSLLAMELDGD